jgi:hypothetical protein
MTIVVCIIVFAGLVWFLLKDTHKSPAPMTEHELDNEGLSPQEIRRELRAQRNEARIHSQTQSQAIRTANQVSKTVVKMLKK